MNDNQSPEPGTGGAAALKDNKKPGPSSSKVQIRPAGPDAQRDQPHKWDKTDEEVDESFPASDPPGNY